MTEENWSTGSKICHTAILLNKIMLVWDQTQDSADGGDGYVNRAWQNKHKNIGKQSGP